MPPSIVGPLNAREDTVEISSPLSPKRLEPQTPIHTSSAAPPILLWGALLAAYLADQSLKIWENLVSYIQACGWIS